MMATSRALYVIVIGALASSLILLPPFTSGGNYPLASGQSSFDFSSSMLQVTEIRLYNYTDNQVIDFHTGEPSLSLVPRDTQVVINGLTRNQNYSSEHFDYIAEVFDSNGVVVYLDVRLGVSVPLAGQVGIDATVPIIFDELGNYTVKLFALSNLSERSPVLLSFVSKSIEVVDTVVNVDQPPDVPNMVVIVADDLDQRSLDILLQEGMMPNLQRYIIDEGVTFSESFATYPLCCPSRATFLTGQYPHNHNVWNNDLPLGGVSKLDDSSTLATWLNDAGYYTALVGKYLNRYGQDTAETYIPPGWDDWQATVGGSAYRMYSYTVNDNGVLVKYGSEETDYQTDVLAARTVQVINEAEGFDSTPFFLWVNPLAPHNDGQTEDCVLNYGSLGTTKPPARYIGVTSDIPFPQPPSFNEADVSDKPRTLQEPPLSADHIACFEQMFHARMESMLAVDDMIGDIVEALDDNGESMTAIVFWSDNGYLLGEHRLHGKQLAYEESIRLPLYIRLPEVSAKTIDKMVINNDLAPTFLDIANAQSQAGFEIDGRSLIPLIDNSGISWRNGFMVEDNLYSAVRTQNYVYIVRYNGGEELYDLEADPYQLNSLHRVSSLQSVIDVLDDWREALSECKGSECHILEDRSPP